MCGWVCVCKYPPSRQGPTNLHLLATQQVVKAALSFVKVQLTLQHQMQLFSRSRKVVNPITIPITLLLSQVSLVCLPASCVEPHLHILIQGSPRVVVTPTLKTIFPHRAYMSTFTVRPADVVC